MHNPVAASAKTSTRCMPVRFARISTHCESVSTTGSYVLRDDSRTKTIGLASCILGNKPYRCACLRMATMMLRIFTNVTQEGAALSEFGFL